MIEYQIAEDLIFNFANQPDSFGFYLYRIITDTSSNGYLNYSTNVYLSITALDDEND